MSFLRKKIPAVFCIPSLLPLLGAAFGCSGPAETPRAASEPAPPPVAAPPAPAPPAPQQEPAAATENEAEEPVGPGEREPFLSDFQMEENGDLRLVVRLAPLDRKNRKLKIVTEDKYRYLDSIDGRLPYGTDGWIPAQQVEAVEVCWQKHAYRLPREAFADLFDCGPGRIFVEGDKLTFSISGGDGSASFSAFYEISRSTLKGKRVVVDDADIQEEDPDAAGETTPVRLLPLGKSASSPCSAEKP